MDEKLNLGIHHIEICCQKDTDLMKIFGRGFEFLESHRRETKLGIQKVFSSGKITFILTKKSKNSQTVYDTDYPMLFCCDEFHCIDSVFNVCFEVSNLEKILKNVEKDFIIKESYVIEDENGAVRMAVIKSKCPNVIHTLLEKRDYDGFLPGFHPILDEPKAERKSYLLDFLDHITYVCHAGDSSSIISWYEKIFQMKRFLANR